MKIRVLLSIPDLQDLGVQHDVRTLMKYWDRKKFNVRLLVHSRSGNFADQFPDEWPSIEIDKFSLNLPKIRVISRIDGYRKAINFFKPHAVISFVPFCNYACIWAKIAGRHKFGLAISEHAHVTAAMKDKENMGNLFMRFYRFTFPYFYNLKAVNIIKCIAEESRDDLIKNYNINPAKTILIYNPVPIEEIEKLSKEKVDHEWFKRKKAPILINVGRLVYQKRQDLLIKAFAEVFKKIDCRLIIIGRGNQKVLKFLKDLAKKLEVDDKIYFAGFQKNPWKWMAKADLFILSSIWEGLPCVLTEAMVLGLPIISTACPSGPTEMLLNGKAGYLCKLEDVNDLKDKIIYALTHPKETKIKTKIAKENLYRFDPKYITKQYEKLAEYLANIYNIV